MSAPAGNWRPLLAILCYALLVIIGGALLAPWLFWATHPFFDYPFRRVFNRALLIVALAGLWPLLRGIGLHSWVEFGFPAQRRWWRDVLIGFGLGVVSLLVAAFLSHGSVAMKVSAGMLAKVLVTAIVVAVLEESFFRGGLQGALQRTLHWLPAILLTSVIYSALHFLKPSGVKIAADGVNWSSGFTCLGAIVGKSYSAPDLALPFLTLFLVGCILGWTFRRTQALYLPIGLHAGWVMANEFLRAAARIKVVEDWQAWPVLLVVWFVVARMCRRRNP